MLEFACLPAKERAAIFDEAGSRRGIGSHIIEKDFWVCWLLGRLFSDPELTGAMIFKGGTSLSKAYDIIHRFSEDIDLTLNPEWLGFSMATADAELSRTQRDKRAKQLADACEAVVRDRLMARCVGYVERYLSGVPATALTFEVDPTAHSPVIWFAYPRVGGATGSLRPQLKLEFGARYDQQPSGEHAITPITAEVFPDLFRQPKCAVIALAAERTFWEKATILHAEYHRPADKPAPTGISRHYYDLYCLSKNAAGERALADTELLTRVREHKQMYFRSAWAHYETATVGGLRLAPAAERRAQIERDYRAMADMFMAPPPSFATLLEHLTMLENRFNDMLA
ncbi:MAG: hypothetical protein A2107_07090 [Verrucomicrobia bacterium GWF2_62_7]|nr:MAG: hypothetical protein A2107_07090 [Verrucomicrobia bacterium GWF2_62_7]